MSKKIDDLLLEKLSQYGLGIGNVGIISVASKLKKEFCIIKTDTDKVSIISYRDELEKLGKILEENNEDNYYLLSVGGGFFNMNPSICIVKLDEKQVIVIGYAKEGLIKQNSAKKAVKRIINVVNAHSTTPKC